MNHIMLDLETLSAKQTAAIVAIGAVRFDLEKLEIGKTYYQIVDGESSIELGCHFDYGTLRWWMKQSDEARSIFNSSAAIDLDIALQHFSGFVNEVPETYVWGNGEDFDNQILKHAYKACGIEYPVQAKHDICYRTIKTVFPSITINRSGTYHNALDDAFYQTEKLMKIMKETRKFMTAIKFPKREAPKPKPYNGPPLKTFDYALLDFETEAVELRPAYPPKPVSASLQMPGDKEPKFFAWGHPHHFFSNNCTKEKFGERLRDLWRSDIPVVCQHGKFDQEVAEKHFGLPLLPWERAHDTEFLLFLHDPHARSLALKESAERILKIKPAERDMLKDWILDNCSGAREGNWGEFISKAPGYLVEPYANGDNFRAGKLFDFLLKYVHEHGMMQAYERERKVMPIFLRNEQQGIRCDMVNLERDYKIYLSALEVADNWLRKRLKSPNLNLDADYDVGEAFEKAGVVREWIWTKGGKNRPPQRSVSKKNLTIARFADHKVALVYAYRNRLRTSLSMFMEPWLEIARKTGGTIHTEWNQVRQQRGNGLVGTRTGRPSTNDPNFLNISKNFEDKDDGYEHPTFVKDLPPLPLMRKYMLPDKGEVWGHRDFNQQELRMLAHFEDKTLKDHYCEKPYRTEDGKMRFDIHTTVQAGVLRIAMLELTRAGTKILNFSDIYGKGLDNLAESLGVDRDTCKQIREAKNNLMPGVAALIKDIQDRGKRGEAIRTWGGREYFAEKAAFSKKYGRIMDFFYKLTNYLIQGSSADVTKEALYRYDCHPKREARFLVTVYDEINSSMHPKRLNTEMKILRESMESIETDVPMLSDGKTGIDWNAVKSCWKELACERQAEMKIERWWN